MLAVWPALGVAVAGLVAGGAVAGVRGVRAWRLLKATKGALGEQAGEIAAAAAGIEQHLASAEASSQRLSTALARLRRSRARLEVQLQALQEAQATVGRALPFLRAR